MKNYLNKLLAKKKAKKGFTLVELLVVIAILAILATVSVVGYLGFTTDAKKSNDLTELAQYKTLVLAKVVDGSETVSIKDGTDDAVYKVTYGKDENVTSYKMSVSEEKYTKCAENATAVDGTKYYEKSDAGVYSEKAVDTGNNVSSYYTFGADNTIDAAEAAAVINAIIGTENQIIGGHLSVAFDGTTTNISVISYYHNTNNANQQATWTISTDVVAQAK